MSYSGYRQFWCENGHENVRDAYDDSLKICDYCKADIVHWNAVDTTNGSIDENGKRIDNHLELKEISHDTIPCKVCNGTGERLLPVYKLPKKLKEKR